MLQILIQVLLALLAIYATASVLYYVGLAVSYFAVREGAPPAPRHHARFAVVIPAHDEELVVGATLESWAAVRYPRDRFSLYVIADNCTDRTATIARSRGAMCLERTDVHNRGKGQALAWALARIPLQEYEALAIVDADCTASASFLEAMNARLATGAKVIQGFDGVLNPDESMLTRLIQITNVMKNRFFMHAKSKLGLAVQLMGTGMCFERSVLQQMSWTAFSIGEDLEQSTHLAQAGIKVVYEPRAIVYAQEASSFRQAYTQRLRWASSRMALFGVGSRLLARGLLRRDVHAADAGMSLVTPNYALLANLTIVGLVIALSLNAPAGFVWWFVLLITAQGAYFALGLGSSGLSARSLASLSLAPVFLMWKLLVDVVALFTMGRRPWTRTARRANPSPET